MRHIPTWWKQPSFLEFKRLYSLYKKDALFFIGSGVSRQAGFPNWRDLLDRVLEQSRAYLKEPVTLKELNELYREMEEHAGRAGGKEFVPLKERGDIFNRDKEMYPAIASYLKRRLDAEGATSWREILNGIFDKPQSERWKSPIHDAVVALEWHGIITTNYDTCIEDAYKHHNEGALYVARPDKNEQGLDRRDHERFIYKIHGDIRDPDSTIVLTREDYNKIYGSSATDETPTKANLRGVLRGAEVILFAGYSHDDEMMRNFYAQAMKYTPRGNAFALVPMEGNVTEIEEKISRLSSELGIRFIGYSKGGGHRELFEFFEYLADPARYDAELNSRIYAKKPTVIMLYCGGTIASSKGENETARDNGPLKITKVPSRFDPQLSDFSELLLDWYQDTYNLGSSVKLEVKWEILPPEHQVFSENATPELWNVILDKVEQVTFKYFQAPQIVGDDSFLKPREDKKLAPDYKKVHQLYDEENEDYKRCFGDELSHSEFISDFQSRYILGIILLTGTDTMGYLVSALSFGFQHMPCSMIVTGSNQPPDQSIPARVPDLNRSDSWKNILTAFYFLQSFGHTLTDSFICFGDTIHHGVNVRKIASELGPISSSLSKDVEPFVFRNLHIRGQYMFRLIDGVFCNNYYPSWIPYSKLVGVHGKELDLRHIRRDPLQRDKGSNKPLDRSYFCENTAICHVVASPSLPKIAVNLMCDTKSSSSPLRAVIIEGYASGTYPTRPGNNFERLLYDLYQHAIPIYLISQYGRSEEQQDYEVEPIRGIRVPITIMGGLTVETALPILSLVVSRKSISDEEWSTARPVMLRHGNDMTLDGLLQHRRNLIEKRLHSFYTARPNILTYEIVPEKITKKERSEDVDDAKTESTISEMKRKGKIQHRGEISPETLESFTNLTKEFKSKYVFLYKHDFSLLVSEITRRDESKGAGPDGFAALSDMGFEYGLAMVQAVADSLPLNGGRGYVKLFQRELDEQKEMLTAAVTIIETITGLLRSTTVANVNEYQVCFPDPVKLEPNSEAPKQNFSFIIKSKRFETLADVDEKYTAVSFSDGDASFFEKLTNGCNPEEDNLEKHYRDIGVTYEQLLRGKWKHITTSLDWLLIGIFKGVTCGIAEFLRFDDMAIDAGMIKKQRSHSVFRKAAHCFVLAGDRRYFEIRLAYHESKTLLDDEFDN